jgi:hypothetical protein
MGTYIFVSLGSGILLALLDAVLIANPLAQSLYSLYGPISRRSILLVRGCLINIGIGFLLAGFYLILYRAMPVPPGVTRAISFGFLVWVLRTLMSTLSHWAMFDVPNRTLLYHLGAGFLQSMAVALFYYLTLSPVA